MTDIAKALSENADTAALVADILYGDSYEVAKSLYSEAERRKALKETRTGQAANVLGLTGSAGAIATGGKVLRDTYKQNVSSQVPKLPKGATLKQRAGRAKKLYRAAMPKGAKGVAVRGAMLGAAGNFGLQVADGIGDSVQGVVLMRNANRQKREINAMQDGVKKSNTGEFGVFCEISKVDDDKRQVFGWASISKKDGMVITDHQGDSIDTEELEKAAYKYMLDSRKGGHEHQKTDEGPLHVADVIESFVVTDEKKKAMGLPDDVPEGWWIGMKVNDDKVWELAKSGELAGFSIHGSGRRVPRNA